MNRAWDLAASEPKEHSEPDYATGILLAYDTQPKLYIILDVQRKQLAPADTEQFVKQTAIDDGHGVVIWLEQEPGSAGKNVVSMFSRYTLEGYIVKSIRVSGPKFVRAQPILAAIGLGNVRMLRAPWNNTLRAEIDAFPDPRAHDDQIDALSLGYQGHQVWNRSGATWGRKKPGATQTPKAYNTGAVWGRKQTSEEPQHGQR